MKNLFNSASACGNPAKKFIYKGEIMNSAESAEDSVLNVPDYNDVSDVEGKFHSPKVVQDDPDVDQDFIAQIEAQGKEPPYAADAKEIISIIEEKGSGNYYSKDGIFIKVNNKYNPGEIITYAVKHGFGAERLEITTNNSTFIVEGNFAHYSGKHGKEIEIKNDGTDVRFAENINKLLSILKEHVGQKDEPKHHPTGLIFDDEEYQNTPKWNGNKQAVENVAKIIDKKWGMLEYQGSEGERVTIIGNEYGGFDATSKQNGKPDIYVSARIINGRVKTYDAYGKENSALMRFIIPIEKEVKDKFK